MRLIFVRSSYLIYLFPGLLFHEGGGGLCPSHFKNALKLIVVRQKNASDNFCRDLLNCGKGENIFKVSEEMDHHVLSWCELEMLQLVSGDLS